MSEKKPTHIRVSNLEKTLQMVESVIEELEDERVIQGAEFAIKLIRKQYGLDKRHSLDNEKARE